MIIKLSDKFALFTNWTQDRSVFVPDTIRVAERPDAEEALRTIPRGEISSCPDSFRDLAILLLGVTWIGEFSETALAVLED